MINCKNVIGDEEWLYVVVVLVNKVMVGVVGGTSLQVEMCVVLIIKGNGSIWVGDVWMTERKITKSDCKYYRESDGNCLNFTYVGEYDPCTDGDLEHCYEKFPHFFNKELKEWLKNFRVGI